MAVVAVIVVGVIVIFVGSRPWEKPAPIAAVDSKPPPAPPSAPAAPPTVMEVLAVAARNANVRATPAARAKIIGTLPRGTALVVLDESDGFVRCRAGGQPEGWIARSILIGKADADRLAGLSADVYVESRKDLRVIEKVLAHVNALEPELFALRGEALSRSPSIADTILAMESHAKPDDIPRDIAAGTWFSLAARASLDSGDDEGSFRSAAAAVFADPLNPDYHMALGYAAVKQEDKKLISAMSAVLLALAPGSTNTWVITGVAAAMEDLPPLAAGSFAQAIERSKSRSTTLKVLKDMATKARDARVSAAIEAALDEANKSASDLSQPGTSSFKKDGT
jgi:hypothetical protein